MKFIFCRRLFSIKLRRLTFKMVSGLTSHLGKKNGWRSQNDPILDEAWGPSQGGPRTEIVLDRRHETVGLEVS